MARILADEHIPVGIVYALRRLGHDTRGKEVRSAHRRVLEANVPEQPAGSLAALAMNAPQTATANSVHQWHGRALRAVLRLAAATAVGFVGGTLGYFEFANRIIAIQSPPPESGVFICFHVSGFGDFCLASIYATCFGLLARRATGRFTGAIVVWLALACTGLMIAASIADPTKSAGELELLAGTVGGLLAGLPIALYVFFSGLAEKRDKSLGPSRFSLKALLWIVAGFAVLFSGLQLRGEYERWRHRDLIRDAAKMRAQTGR